MTRYSTEQTDNRIESEIQFLDNNNSITDTYSSKPGCPIEFKAQLFVKLDINSVLNNRDIKFYIEKNGIWEAILEDGITFTQMKTNDYGKSSNYYLCDDIMQTEYNIKAVFEGDTYYKGCQMVIKLYKYENNYVVYSQIRAISKKRLHKEVGAISSSDFEKTIN